jgi:hypothetical protein
MTQGSRSVLSSTAREVVVRRISLAAVAIAASSLAVAIFVAPAGAKTHKSHKPKPVKVTRKCDVSETLSPPSGSDEVVPPVSQGTAYGSAKCVEIGAGEGSMSMTLQDSGDVTGTWWHYFKTGALYGTYDLTPGASQPTGANNFAAATYTGTMVVTGATGTLSGITGKGTSTCTTPDSVHFVCTEKLSLTYPPVLVASNNK